MMLGPMFDPSDPLTAMFMAGSEHFAQPFYSTQQAPIPKSSTPHPSYDSMSATLSPSALEVSLEDAIVAPPVTSVAPASSFAVNSDGGADFVKGQSFTRSNSSHGSGTATPGNDGNWDLFINSESWNDNPT